MTHTDISQECLPPTGRRVLDGAFAVLDALAGAELGLGLTELTRESGLAKASTYRLAEQLVSLGAVQRHGRRYYVGPRLASIGQRWQPDLRLRRLAHPRVRNLAAQSGVIAYMSILDKGRLRLICATAPRGLPRIPEPADDCLCHSATGRVLYAARSASGNPHPGCLTAREWRGLRSSVRHMHATVVDRQDVLPGICCVAAPVWSPTGRCAGAVTAMLDSTTVPPSLPELVSRTARAIGIDLARATPVLPIKVGR
jgi:DNA-binding IclR family transcriptional regulator